MPSTSATAFSCPRIANSYLVTTSDGDVMINTGTDFEAQDIKSRFSRVSNGPLRMITFTQGHPDHVGGWSSSPAQGQHDRAGQPPRRARVGGDSTRSTSAGS